MRPTNPLRSRRPDPDRRLARRTQRPRARRRRAPARGARVAPRRSRRVEPRHHGHVLVLRVVAVEDVAAAEGPELDVELHLIVRTEHDGVLLARLERRRRPTVARQDLEGLEVDVDRMGPLAAVVLQGPDLRYAELRERDGAVAVEEP